MGPGILHVGSLPLTGALKLDKALVDVNRKASSSCLGSGLLSSGSLFGGVDHCFSISRFN